MDPIETLRELSLYVPTCDSLSVLVVADGDADGEVVVQRLRITEQLANHFRDAAKLSINGNIDELGLREYEPTLKLDNHELCYLQLEDATEVAEVIRAVTRVDTAEIFKEAPDVMRRLRFYAFVMSDGRQPPAVFMRTCGAKNFLPRHRMMAAILGNDVYDRFDQKLLLFDQAVDCFSWNGTVFMRSVYVFHRIFRYLERLRSRAAQTMSRVSSAVPIHNLEDFRSACTSQLGMMAKLASVSRKPYLDKLSLDVVKSNAERFGVKLGTIIVDGTEALVYDPKDRWSILKVLDDDYLISEMTYEQYEANSKSRVRPSSN